MAEVKKSENVNNIESDPIEALHRKRGQKKVVIDQAALVSADLDEAGDKSLYGPIPSNAVLTEVAILNDDLDSDGTPALAVDVGLAYSGIGGKQNFEGRSSGDIIDADALASASDALQAANVKWESVRFEADDIVDVKKEAWEVAGLSEDPGGLFYIALSVTTAAATAAAGDVVVKVEYI